MPCAIVLADRAFEIVGGAKPALAPLHVDDRAERALVGAAAPEIEARQRAGDPADVARRQDRRRLAFERRQIVHEIIERLQRAVAGVPQHLVEPALLGLAGEKRDAERLRLRAFPAASRAASRSSPTRETRRCIPAIRRPETAAPDRRRAETGSTARRPSRSARRRPARRIARMMRSGRTRWLVSSKVWRRIAVSGPSTRRRLASSASALRQASVFDGIAALTHWIG